MGQDHSLDWQLDYAHVLEDLDPSARSRVLDAIQSNVIEGFAPTEADVAAIVAVVTGAVTMEAFIAATLADPA